MWGADAVLNYRLLPPNVLGCEILIFLLAGLTGKVFLTRK